MNNIDKSERDVLISFIMKVADCYDMDNRDKAEKCVDDYLSN